MKTNNRKILQLINHGFSGSLLSDLNEGQINSLYKRLVESITTNDPKKALELNKMDPNANVQLTTETDDFEVYEDTDSEMEWVMKGDTQDPIQKGPTGDGDPDSLQEYKNLAEKFESKKQQKYFFAKCGDGKTKEQKKWCKMAEEFAEKTNFKKLPEKKKETKEGYMDMVGGAITKANLMNLDKVSPRVRGMGESELEKKIMKLVEKHITPKMSKKDFLSLVSEQETKPKIKEPITKPNEPSTPYSPKPGPKKAPKAHKREFDEQETKPKIKEPITKPNEPSTPYSPKPGPKKAPKASKGKLPSWLSFKSIGIKLK
jgi:hypothetical protein